MIAAKFAGRSGNWPMLTRVLVVMMAGVLAVQLVNFTLLQYAPLPRPPVFTVAQVARVLRAGSDPTDELRLTVRAAPTSPTQGRALELSALLARELAVDPSAIRLSFIDPPWRGRRAFGPHGPWDRRSERSDALLVGDFVVALRRDDRHWLTAQPVHSGLAAWRFRLLFWLIAALITVAPFAWLLARWVSRPVAIFADAAERIGRNPHTTPLAVSGPAEIAHAARAMNQMQERLTRFVDDRTLMIGAIAHDLRTPLMRMAIRLEHAPDTLRRGIERDMADMQSMIAAATDYVRGVTQVGTRRWLDLHSLAESAADEFNNHGGQVIVIPGEQVVIEGDPVALRTVIDNLLVNALRYAGDAEVTVMQEEGQAVVEVRDHGPGLSPEDLDRVMEPFFRGEQSRNRDTGGLGLGLASVRGVVGRHGGTTTIVNHPDGGLLARIVFPA